MARTPEPRYYASRDGWYAKIAGKQYLLAKGKGGKKEAHEAFHLLMVQGGRPASKADPSLQTLAFLFLADAEPKLSPLTYEFYRRHLQSFVDAFGSSKAADLRPLHVTRWLGMHAWSDTTKSGAITAVKRLYRWAKREGHLDANPLAEVERPAIRERTAVLTADQARAIFGVIKNPRLHDFLTALWETGCRPAEVSSLSADRVDLSKGTWKVINKTRHKTREPYRIVLLTPAMVELSARLVALHPDGLIFRNAKGNPWTRNAMACAFRAIRAKLGFGGEATAYAYRHRFVTDALVGNTPVATVATLVGHKSTAMVMKRYSHLADEHDHLRDAVNGFRAAKPSPGGEASSSAPSAGSPGATEGDPPRRPGPRKRPSRRRGRPR